MNIIYAEYNIHRNSIDIATSAGYILRIDCWEAEKDLKTTPGSECALNALAIDLRQESVCWEKTNGRFSYYLPFLFMFRVEKV